MPPRRKDETLPPYTTISKGRYVYRPYNKETKKKGSEVPLCSVSDGKEEAWRVYFEVSKVPEGDSLSMLLEEYYRSAEYKNLKIKTQEYYRSYGDDLCRFELQSGGLLGDAPYNMITVKFGRGLLKKLTAEAYRSGQMKMSFLKSVMSWAFEAGKLDTNPLADLSVGKRKKSTVNNPPEIKDLQFAFSLAPPKIKAFIIIAISCRGRSIEAIDLRKDQAKEILHEGRMVQVIDYSRAKGSKDNYIIFSPQLAEAWNWDKEEKGKFSQWVLHQDNGDQYTESALKSAWARLMAKVKKKGGKPFTKHSLKHLGVTLDTGDKCKGSGLTEIMVRNIYDHSKPVVDSVI
jgi:integrase